MADGASQDPSLDGIEEEVNDLIAGAESLTAELKTEIGDEGTQPTEREAEFFESETDSEASLDVQFAQADVDLSETSKELGQASPPAPKKKALTLPTKKKKISLPSRATKSSAKPTNESESPPTDSFVSDFDDTPQNSAEGIVAAQLAEPPFELKQSQPSRLAALKCHLPLAKLNRLWAVIAEVTCSVLDVLDRPFYRVNHRARLVMGWLALIFAVTAISLFVFVVL